MSKEGLEPKNLRIGNIVKGIYLDEEEVEQSHFVSVVALDSVGATEFPIWVECLEGIGPETYLRLEPIELTEDWLVRLGFLKGLGKYGNTFCILEDNGFVSMFTIEHWTNVDDNSKFKNFWYCRHMLKDNKLKYVHQVQNIFHSLTDCELELSPLQS